MPTVLRTKIDAIVRDLMSQGATELLFRDGSMAAFSGETLLPAGEHNILTPAEIAGWAAAANMDDGRDVIQLKDGRAVLARFESEDDHSVVLVRYVEGSGGYFFPDGPLGWSSSKTGGLIIETILRAHEGIVDEEELGRIA